LKDNVCILCGHESENLQPVSELIGPAVFLFEQNSMVHAECFDVFDSDYEELKDEKANE